MKQVLFEEDGAFRVGTILSEAGGALQVEAAHGKRSKVKATAILLRFDGQPLLSFISDAQAQSEAIDRQFLWEVCSAQEFGFADLAADYFGQAPSPVQAAAVALALHANPMYFYRRGRGRYQAAPAENLRAALAGVEKKRRQQEQVDAWAASLARGEAPEEIAANLDTLLFKPDKMSLPWRALEQAAAASGNPPAQFLASVGLLQGPQDYWLRKLAFDRYPGGLGFPDASATANPPDLAQAAVEAFSIDDQDTTEIDDAFSVTRLSDGSWRVGVHIAAPALLFGDSHPLEALARERLSTVYYPGGKITMLPESAVAGSTLAAGHAVAAVSLYVVVDPDTLDVKSHETRVERVPIAANLRTGELESRLTVEALAAGGPPGPFGAELGLLWQLARKLRAARGAQEERADRVDYTFRVEGGHVSIEVRPRGSPVDTLVAEWMIHVNATWGRLLAEAGIPGLYRNQRGAKTRMEAEPGAHEGLGVTHYAWSSSPIRRFADLANQRQIIALALGEAPPHTREALDAVAGRFEEAYEAYGEFQRQLERYWCLRFIAQERLGEADATVIRDELVRLINLPLVCRVTGMPSLAPGDRVRVVFGEADYWETHLPCRYAGRAEGV